ncbi:MAG: phosphoribosyltransferase, partial [Chloroflexi bacterium]|nr:phosphoribosyltransferase [Chloroflexota bacterium]
MLQRDLLNDLSSLSSALEDALQNGDGLNAYLLAVGINQIVEDGLHPDPLHLDTANKYLRRLPTLLGITLFASIQVAGRVMWFLHEKNPQTRSLRRWQTRWEEFIEELSPAAAGGISPDFKHLYEDANELLKKTQRFPESLRRQKIRLPSCFRSFDQHPDDLSLLVDRFARQWNDKNKPVVVVGVRTSGSYLAPLIAFFLRQAGFCEVQTMTLRTGRRLLSSEKRWLRRAAREGAVAVLSDDPPTSGSSLVKAAQMLAKTGFRNPDIVLLLQLFGDDQSLPMILKKYPASFAHVPG